MLAQKEAQLMLFMNVSRKSMTYALRPLRMHRMAAFDTMDESNDGGDAADVAQGDSAWVRIYLLPWPPNAEIKNWPTPRLRVHARRSIAKFVLMDRAQSELFKSATTM